MLPRPKIRRLFIRVPRHLFISQLHHLCYRRRIVLSRSTNLLTGRRSHITNKVMHMIGETCGQVILMTLQLGRGLYCSCASRMPEDLHAIFKRGVVDVAAFLIISFSHV
jgi:hypothetical protein